MAQAKLQNKFEKNVISRQISRKNALYGQETIRQNFLHYFLLFEEEENTYFIQNFVDPS